jgi:hypothetical protein
LETRLLNRIKEFKTDVKNLPDEIYSHQEFLDHFKETSDERKSKIINLQHERLEQKEKLKRKLLGFFAANLDDDSNYYSLLGKITFRPKEGVYNSFHIRNNEAWLEDKKKLLILLELMENEFTEKLAATKTKPSISFQEKDMFSSGLFWTITTVLCGLAYFLGLYKAEFDKSRIENELNQQKVINTNQAKKIDSLKLSLKLKK